MNINTPNILRANKNQLIFQFYQKISILGVIAMILTPDLAIAKPPDSKTLIAQISTNAENQPAIFLELGKPIQQTMAGNQKHQYQINLQAGEYLHLTVNQKNIDLLVSLLTPQGEKLIVSDSLNGAYGIEPISAIAPITGKYLIEIQSDPRAKKTGSYEIQLKEQQIPTAENQERMQAERKFMAAVQTYLQATKEAKELSLQEFQAALLTYQAINDPMMIGAILSIIGSIYDDMGEKTEALNYYNQALPMRKTAGDKSGEANTLTSMGLVYNAIGEKEKALQYYNQALLIFQAIGDQVGEGTTLNNLGVVYHSLGDQARALEYYQQALPMRQAVGDQVGEASALNNIGYLYDSLAEPEKALTHYQQALVLSQSIGDRVGEATTLNNMGGVYDALAEPVKALTYYNQALPLRRAMGDRSGEAAILNNIGNVYADQGEYAKALAYLNQALPIRQAVGNRAGEAITLFNLAYVQRQKGDLQTALKQIESAITILEDLRTKIASQEMRQSYFATVQNYYQFYIDLLMELHAKEPTIGYDAMALHASERGRARSLLELLAEGSVNIYQGVDTNLINQEKSLISQINQAEGLRIEYLNSRQPKPENLAAVNQKIDSLLIELNQVKSEIKKTNPHYAQLTQPTPLTVKEIQEQLLDDQTLLLEYFLGETRSYLWVVSKNQLNTYQLPRKSELKTIVNEFLQTLSHPRQQKNIPLIDQIADRLTNMILTPAAQEIAGKRLLIVADGPLQYIPFGALSLPNSTSEGAGYQPMISKQTLINLPSASTLAIIRQDTAKRPLAPKKLAIIADPVFSLDDERLPTRNQQNSQNLINQKLPDNQSNNPANNQRGNSTGMIWQRLPFTRQEADAISALLPQAERKKVLDFQADYNNVMAGNLAEYQIIHMATHGFINTEQPALSAIILSLINAEGNTENGYLRLNDIFNLNLPAELVVLSACQTGLGKEVKGEGLVGLTRGFMYAGAKRVVVSLWNVNDEKTAELMTNFYQKMLQENFSPAEALRMAQVEMWQKGYSPYYWGAFTLQGDWH